VGFVSNIKKVEAFCFALKDGHSTNAEGSGEELHTADLLLMTMGLPFALPKLQ
jgi:hypothetical protein